MNSRHVCFKACRSNAEGEARRPRSAGRRAAFDAVRLDRCSEEPHPSSDTRSGSPACSTYSRVCTDRVYHFCVQKPVQARKAAFPRSNPLSRARGGVSRVPLLSRDFREPVRPMSPTSLILQGSRRVERQFVPLVPVSVDLYARTHARTRTHRGSSEEAVQPVHGTLSPDQDCFRASLLPVHEVEHRVPTISETARISPLNWGFRGIVEGVLVPRNPVRTGTTKNPPGSRRSSGDDRVVDAGTACSHRLGASPDCDVARCSARRWRVSASEWTCHPPVTPLALTLREPQSAAVAARPRRARAFRR